MFESQVVSGTSHTPLVGLHLVHLSSQVVFARSAWQPPALRLHVEHLSTSVQAVNLVMSSMHAPVFGLHIEH